MSTGTTATPEYRPAADLFPFESHWYMRDGYRVHYVDEGSGRPVLLLHGNATFSSSGAT